MYKITSGQNFVTIINMKTQKITNGTLVQLKETLGTNNKAAIKATAKHKVAATPLAKRLSKRTNGASAGSAKLVAPKKKIYQTGISSTIENALKVNMALGSFLPAYESPIPALALPALGDRYLEAKGLEQEVIDQVSKHTVNLDIRRAYYKGLNTYGAQIVNMMKACGVDKKTLENARKCLKKMQGVRIIPKKYDLPNENYNRASHTGFVDKLGLFGDLIEITANYDGYAVVTGRLSEAEIRAHYAALNDANDAADTSEATLNAARRLRNAYFNTEITGLVDTYHRVKSIVKANYGTKSAEYKTISALVFRRIDG
ncbi:MAG: hypothetical protein ACSHXF_13460 [Aquaticitalea sp.]